MSASSAAHHWSFFRSGGVDQVSLDSGADLVALASLDQKLWVALSCPTTGLELDRATLALIDTDNDGRIRPPEIIAAVSWACGLLRDPGLLLRPTERLPLAAIDDSNEQGRAVLASAKQILTNLGQTYAQEISVEDVTDTKKIFAETRFNGDGIVIAEATEDTAVKTVITQIIECLGAETDRSGKPGVDEAKVDAFFTEAAALAAWWEQAAKEVTILPLEENTAAAHAAVEAVRVKVDDYFARCRLAAFDARAIEALNREEKDYLALAAKDLQITSEEIASLPLARVAPGQPLPLTGGVNPAWAAALAKLAQDAVKPLCGSDQQLTEDQWGTLLAALKPYAVWQAAKPTLQVEQLGIERVREILGGPTREALKELITQDRALAAEAESIADVHKLVLYHRDLARLLNNYVSFQEFYSRKDKAIFQAGTLYLDRRSCDLCIRVEDVTKHSALAGASKSLLVYCNLTRKATGESMSIVAALTGGDADQLFVGRNGIFYDRQGRDWDATVVKLVDNPVSVRQAIWSPYKKFLKLLESQIEKMAAAKDKALQDKAAAGVASTGDATAAGKPLTKKDAFDVAKFAGIFAAIGLAIGAIGGVLGAMFGAFTRLAWWQMPLALLGLMLMISGPSVVIAWLKLRQRNVGPLLDACGWAVNAQAKINIPFGGTLTHEARLPDDASYSRADAFKPRSRAGLYLVLVLLAALAGLWYFGVVERYLPGLLPRSGWVERRASSSLGAPAPAAGIKPASEIKPAPAVKPAP